MISQVVLFKQFIFAYIPQKTYSFKMRPAVALEFSWKDHKSVPLAPPTGKAADTGFEQFYLASFLHRNAKHKSWW